MDPEPRALTTSLGHNTLTKAGTTPCRLFSHTYAMARVRVSAYLGNMARSPHPV